MTKGKLIVIEGLDGSGKTTQHRRLLKRLKDKGVEVTGIEFPNRKDPASTLIKMYLNGDLSEHPDDVNPYGSSVFYSAERFASYEMYWKKQYRDNGIIISARYTSSNLFHQMSKLDKTKWNDFKDWLYDLEYKKMEIPKPDRTIFLDVEPDVSKELIEKRNIKKDIHENNNEYLLRCREAALYAVEKWGFVMIECSRNGEMKSEEIIENLLYEEIKDLI